MTFDTFITINTGKKIDVDGFPKNNPWQCTDLMRQYFKDVLYKPLYCIPGDIRGAKYIFGNFSTNKDFTKVLNTPTNVPKKGDIFFFKTSILPPWRFGLAGHVGIIVWADINNLVLFNQNYPTGSSCQLTKFSYKDAQGWLTPR
jgi:hypothetical protein